MGGWEVRSGGWKKRRPADHGSWGPETLMSGRFCPTVRAVLLEARKDGWNPPVGPVHPNGGCCLRGPYPSGGCFPGRSLDGTHRKGVAAGPGPGYRPGWGRRGFRGNRGLPHASRLHAPPNPLGWAVSGTWGRSSPAGEPGAKRWKRTHRNCTEVCQNVSTITTEQ